MNRDGKSFASSNGEQGGEQWTQKDLVEPQFYPDPVLFRASLEKMTKDDFELKKNLTSNKATLRVLAPYLKIIQKDQRRILQSAISKKPSKLKSPKLPFDKKTREQLGNVVPDISEKYEMILSIEETADVLKVLIKANTAVTYIVNPTTNELFQSPRHTISSTSKLTWKIEEGTTMAAYAAATKQHVMSENVLDDKRFPAGLGFPGTITKYALCVPITTPDGKVVAVLEMSKDAFQKAFDKRDLQLVLAMTGWMGVAILQNSLYTSLVRQHELTDYLVQLTEHHHSGSTTVEKTLSDVLVFARETVGAERCYLYIVDKEHKNALVCDEYDQGSDTNAQFLYKRRTKRHVERDTSRLSRVLWNKDTVNEHQLVTEVALDNEPSIRSSLCVPILSNNRAIGAIQLANKRSASHFSRDDEDILQTFAHFCAININHLLVHENVKKCNLQNSVNQEMLFYHIKPCIHEQEKVGKVKFERLPEDFFTFTWYPSPDDMPRLAELTINMFHEVLGESFMTLNNVPKFVLTVQNCYRPNPYHNFVHAFGVAHAMGNIISRYHQIFTGIERKGLMVAALCHDLDHRGYTNNFIQLTKHYLSSLYETSPLENHHFAVTKLIIQHCGMFRYIKPELYNELLVEIYELIIATDLSLYFQCRMELMRVADERAFTFKNPSHRRLVKSLMMTACDLSGQTKPLPICQKITEDVYEEFYQQGDIEKKMGFTPLPTMDRDKKDMVAENQVQFLSVVVLPCVETVSRIFSNLSPMVWDSKVLLQQWKELLEMKEQKTWKPEESVA